MAENKTLSLEQVAENFKKQMWTNYSQEDVAKAFGVPKPYLIFNTEASSDAIRHFVHGMGDMNPIFVDEDHAGKTKYGALIAPPAFLYSVWWPSGTIGGANPAMHMWNSGNEWEWFRPIMKGDKITYKVISPVDIQLKAGKFGGGRTLLVYSDTEYFNQRGETIAVCKGWSVRAEKPAAIAAGKYAEVQLYKYTNDELGKIYAAQDKEDVRGAKSRYWEDVTVNEELTPVVRGPLTVFEMTAWCIGCGNQITRSDRFWRQTSIARSGKATPFFVDPETGAPCSSEMPHFDNRFGRMVGAPGAYDFGCQRMSWLSILLTNWMGDDGFLWKMNGQLRKFNISGDTTWLKGKVTNKYVENGKYCADIQCWGENQRGEETLPGGATVILPSREHGPVVYPEARHIPLSSA